MRRKHAVKQRFPGPEVYDFEGESERVRELARLVGKMGAPLEGALNLEEEPAQCSLASMIIGEYLRSKGYDAKLVPAYYTRTQPLVKARYGGVDAFISSLSAKSAGYFPVHKRSPKSLAKTIGNDEASHNRALQLLSMAQDSFVIVDLSSSEEGKEKIMVHGAYRQFMPPKRKSECPPILFDRVDAKTLKKKYHLVVSSPEQAAHIRSDEQMIFADKAPQGLSSFERDFRMLVRSKYHDFKRSMDEPVKE